MHECLRFSRKQLLYRPQERLAGASIAIRNRGIGGRSVEPHRSMGAGVTCVSTAVLRAERSGNKARIPLLIVYGEGTGESRRKTERRSCQWMRSFKGTLFDPLVPGNLFALEACATLAPGPSNLQGTPSGAVLTPSLVASAFGFLSPPGRRTRTFGITASFGKHDASAHALRRAGGVDERRGRHRVGIRVDFTTVRGSVVLAGRDGTV